MEPFNIKKKFPGTVMNKEGPVLMKMHMGKQ